MFARRLLVMGVVCALSLMGTAHLADAGTSWEIKDDFATTPHDTPVVIDPTANDLPTAVFDSIVIVDAPQHGSVQVAGLIVTYFPPPGYVGLDAMTYLPRSCGVTLGCNVDTAVIHITVTGPAPTTTTTTEPATTTTTEPATTTTTEPATTTTVAAAGSTIPATTAPTTVAAAAAQLPRTGNTSGGLAALAGGFILAGAAALALSRRRIQGARR